MATQEQKPVISVHPAAAIFPMMSDDEIAEMATSIKQFGLREKIQAIPSVHESHTDWQVVDGRNRLEAIRRHLKMSDTDIIATYIVPVNLTAMHASPEEYVMMANIERRNLTQNQRKSLAGKLAIMLEEQQKDKPKAEQIDTLQVAADKSGVSRRTAATAKQEVKAEAEKAKKPAAAKEKPAEKPYVPLKPINVKTFLGNIGKTLSHQATVEVGGVKQTQPELDKWTVEEVKEAQKLAEFVHTVLDKYLPVRLAREAENLKARLAAVEDNVVKLNTGDVDEHGDAA